MADSILESVKKVLGIPLDYEAFDFMVMTHTNATLAKLTDFGVGPPEGLIITDSIPTWNDLALTPKQTGLVPTYVYLCVRMLFDPPATSFLIDAANKQIAEYEWRLTQSAEELIPLPVPMPVRPKTPNYDGDVEYVAVPTYIDGGY